MALRFKGDGPGEKPKAPTTAERAKTGTPIYGTSNLPGVLKTSREVPIVNVGEEGTLMATTGEGIQDKPIYLPGVVTEADRYRQSLLEDFPEDKVRDSALKMDRATLVRKDENGEPVWAFTGQPGFSDDETRYSLRNKTAEERASDEATKNLAMVEHLEKKLGRPLTDDDLNYYFPDYANNPRRRRVK